MPSKTSSIAKVTVIGLLTTLALAIRIAMFNFVSDDLQFNLMPWYEFIVTHGFFKSFAYNFADYSPPYLYLIDIATLFRWIPSLWAIKIISVLFDFFAAAAVYKILRLKFIQGNLPWAGFLLVLFAPIVVIESGLWGQCDIIYTSFLLWALYCLLKEKYFFSVAWFSLAFVFKFQALFFAPVLMLYFLNRKIHWSWLLVPVGAYFLSIAPAWIVGRSLEDLFTVYFGQFNRFQKLAMNAPNPYIFLDENAPYQLIVYSGVACTALIILGLVIYRWKTIKNETMELCIFDATFFATVAPFFLPKMHERYFFTAGIFLIILAFLNRRHILSALLIQVSSVLSFLPYLFYAPVIYTKIGAFINLLVICLLLVVQFNVFSRKETEKSPS